MEHLELGRKCPELAHGLDVVAKGIQTPEKGDAADCWGFFGADAGASCGVFDVETEVGKGEVEDVRDDESERSRCYG